MKAREICGLLCSLSKITLVIHKKPDGDAVGAAFAVKEALGKLKKNVVIACQDPIPGIFEQVLGKIETKTSLGRPELVIVLDCAEVARTGFESELRSCKQKKIGIIMIDHHRQGNLPQLADVCWKDTRASSTTEMIFKLIQALRLSIDRRIATGLLLGLYTDTGGFSHANTSSEALELAAKLVSYGANLALISETLAIRRTLPQIKLWGQAMTQLKINSSGFAVTKVSQKFLADADAKQADVAGLANWLCGMEGSKVALVLVESGSQWQGTLRTKEKAIDLSKLARQFGGKGTRTAAGFLATEAEISAKIEGTF